MLHNLRIENYALINKLNVELNTGMTVITGETGAGKSILLDALSLLTGQRADISVLQDPSKKCVVEAHFDTSSDWFSKFFSEHNLDAQNISIVRREIASSGTSRAFINDTPVNLSQLKEFGAQLVDIHSQHQTLTLSDSFFKFNFIDVIAENTELVKQYKIDFRTFKTLQLQLSNLLDNEQQAKKDKDYFDFLLNELLEIKLKAGEVFVLENEQKLLSNSLNILQVLSSATNQLINADENITTGLNKIKNELLSITSLNGEYQQFYERISSLYIELKDVGNDIEIAQNNVSNNPERLIFVDERLSSIYRLFKKHNVLTDEDLLNIANELDNKLLLISNYDDEINKLKLTIEKAETSLLEKAKKLSAQRIRVVKSAEKNIKNNLLQLGMPDALFIIDIKEIETLTEYGNNEIVFLFSANKGSVPKEISKVASGGEMSRLMLCLKSLLANKTALQTIIFDEIDTGVSGDVAQKMANIMLEMAKEMQLITITHLAQIASKGQHHLHVIKEVVNSKTNSKIIEIKGEERVSEIAKMLSNANPTKAAIDNAKDLLGV